MSKPAAILLLKRDALMAYGARGGEAQLDLTDDLVRHLEVVDPRSLAEDVAQFADQQGLRKKSVLVLLDESVMFQKTVPANDALNPGKIQQDFEAMLPFEQADKRVLALQPKGHLVLIGTTSLLYRLVILGLTTMGAKVTAVSPASVYGKVTGTFNQQQVSAIIHNRRLASLANFLDLEVQK
jgi:hypothetical protein